MKQRAAMAWKEWHEIRAFLWIALGVFVGLPIIGGFESQLQYSKHFELSATPWVIAFGGVLAVFVAVGATCRDLNGSLEDFWRSCPVSAASWMRMKYAVGLTVVLIACSLPLVLEWALSTQENHAFLYPLALAPIWAVQYSLGFLAGSLIRRTGRAAMVALGAMLLIYFLPVLLPPLKWFGLDEDSDQATTITFFVVAMALVRLFFSMAVLAVTRGWRIEFGRKTMCASIALAFLILFGTTAYKLGTNMPILQQVAVAPDENICLIRCQGNQGFFITRRFYEKPNPTPDDPWQVDTEYRTFEITPSGIRLGAPSPLKDQGSWIWPRSVSPLGYPNISYRVDESDDGDTEKWSLHIGILGQHASDSILPLWTQPVPDAYEHDNWLVTYATQNRLYVIGRRLATLDITQPATPKVISIVPFSFSLAPSAGAGAQKIIQPLPPAPDLTPRQRLEAVFNTRSWQDCLQGDTLCQMYVDRSFAYRLTKLTPIAATFEKIGEYDPSILESVFGGFDYGSMQMQNGLLYTSDGPNWNVWWNWGRSWRGFNPHVTVFDTRGPHPLRVVGHFAAPGAGIAYPLPDGNVLVGGNHLWLVGPPPRRDQN
jgi:hypothetical protein